MNRKEAYQALGVAPSADPELVEHAYRHLTRKCRAETGRDGEAKARLDELEEAYGVLAANGETPIKSGKAPPLGSAEPPLAELVLQWGRQIVAAVVARWRGRVPEISILAGTTVVLAAMAFFAGASLSWTVIVLLAAGVTILAPWRPAG